MDPKTASLHTVDILNFSRTGEAMRFVNDIVPFANATMQAMDSLGRSVKRDPQRFAAIVAQVIVADGLVNTYNALTNPEGWPHVPDNVKVRNHIVMLPKGLYEYDRRGNVRYPYIRIAKETSPFTTPFMALSTAMSDKVLFDKNPSPLMLEGIAAAVPYSQEIAFPPLASFILAMNNVDSRGFKEIYTGPNVGPGAEFDENTPEVWKVVGKSLNLSPDRLSVAMNKIFPASSPAGYAAMLLQNADSETRSTFRAMTMEAPVFRRLVSFTSPYESELQALEPIVQRVETYKKLKVDDPLESILLDIQEGEAGYEDAHRHISESGAHDLIQSKMLHDRVESHRRRALAFSQLRKEHSQEELEGIRSPSYYWRLSRLSGEAAAESFFELWYSLPPKKQAFAMRLAALTPGLRGNAGFEKAFATFRAARGDGYEED